MSFYGKKFKKVNVSGDVVALIASLNLGEKSLELAKNPDSLFSYVDNGDGTFNYDQFVKDTVVASQKFTPGKEHEYVSPDGLKAKVIINITGDTVKTTITDESSRILSMTRVFSGNKATMELTVGGDSRKGTVEYEAV